MRTLLAIFTGLLIFGSLAGAQGTEPRVKRVSSSAVGADTDDKKQKAGEMTDYDFPIILPPYNYKELHATDFGSCLLYIESISVVVFSSGDTEKESFSSGAAIINNSNSRFYFQTDFVKCVKTPFENRNFSFAIKVKTTKKIIAKNGDKSLFYLDKDMYLEFVLKFKGNKDSSWNLEDLDMKQDLVVKPDEWLKKLTFVNASTKSDNAARILFGGFKDYGYACSHTPLIAWSHPDRSTVGLSFNNIQLQAIDSFIVNKTDRNFLRFTANVNDCVGTFSVGSWMAIVVVLVLLAVLAFGYLMLNSVQTMDRFDDPKQKQLIINAKE